ncbi:hypothetical protein EPN42_04725 [bacterium]|nr:MAG: hypothetical protein EPN42_04725 [bacterium]
MQPIDGKLAPFDGRGERFAGKAGFGAYCEQLREAGVSDLMIRQTPLRIAVCTRARFRRFPDELAPYALEWLRHFEELYLKPGVLQDRWNREKTLDVAHRLPGGGFARLHFWRQGGLNLSARIHPAHPPLLDDVLPIESEREEQIRRDLIAMLTRRQGLIVIGGQVRSGKTWLEHALYDYLNRHTEGGHAWLIGDPLEFEHEDEGWIFTPNDVSERGTTQDYEIRRSLRVPRTLIGVGEMRGDTASTEATLTAALAGTLVVATGHFSDVQDIVSRFSLGSAAMSEQSKRSVFLEALQGVIHLALAPGIDGREVLVVSYTDFGQHANLKTDLAEGKRVGPTTIDVGYRPLAADAALLVSKIGRDAATALGARV